MSPARRDAMLLFLVGLAFAAVSGAACAISIHVLCSALHADDALGRWP